MVRRAANAPAVLTRRGFLRGGVSAAALFSLPATAAAPNIQIPSELYQPGVEAMAHTVKAIADLLRPSLIGVDLADLHAVLRNAGQGAFGQAIIMQRKRHVAAEAAHSCEP